MFFRSVAISAILIGMASLATAQNDTHTSEMFKGPRLHQAFSGGDHSKDAILPNGNINLDPSITSSISDTSVFSQPRLQCDSSPNTVGVRTNTYNMGATSGCP